MPEYKRRVLISGGCGFIGVNLVYALRDADAQILIVDDLSAGKLMYLREVAPSVRSATRNSFPKSGNGVWFIEGDIRDTAFTQQVMPGVETVVHLAAHTSVTDSMRQPRRDMEINVQGTVNLLEAARIHGVGRFIFASSGATLGEQIPPVDEEMVPRPAAPYGASKLAGEGYCSAYFKSFGLETVSLRFANVYGPRSFHKGSVIAHFMKEVLHGRPLIIDGDGTQTRDFLYINDLCDAIGVCLSESVKGIGGEVFQIATQQETSINEVASMIENVCSRDGLKTEVVYETFRKGEVHRNYAKITKAEHLLKYKPKTNLSDGIGATWNWFRANWCHVEA
jgi:UDP-glucose 4-epimerase